jgi:hypothetical protein
VDEIESEALLFQTGYATGKQQVRPNDFRREQPNPTSPAWERG